MNEKQKLSIRIVGKVFELKGLSENVYEDLKSQLDENGNIELKTLLLNYLEKMDKLEELQLQLQKLENKLQIALNKSV